MSKESSIESEHFFQLLFELSHESRYMILQFLKEKPLRVTDIAKRLELTSQEISRQVSRLNQINVIYKDNSGYYNISTLGLLYLKNLESLSFTSKNVDYFINHNTGCLPDRLLKRLNELVSSVYLDNVMEFINKMKEIIDESNEYLLLVSDRFPIHSLSEITAKLEKGVKLKIIEPKTGIQGPTLSIDSNKVNSYDVLLGNPVVERRIVNTRQIFILASEKSALLALPTIDNKIDYRGYMINDSTALQWVYDLFTSLWSEQDVGSEPLTLNNFDEIEVNEDNKSVILHGYDDHKKDRHSLQRAVEKFEEILLRGSFNLGDKGIIIKKDVKIKGEGRKNGKPSTYVYMSGWTFPFTELDSLFLIDADNCDVSIENIFFNDFKFACIHAVRGNKITLKNNWIELDSIGRGRTSPIYGDTVMGIVINGPGLEYNPGFPGGIIIEDNYLNFASSFAGGFYGELTLLTTSERETALLNHKYFNSYGIYIRYTRGKVLVKNNIIKNTSSRGISASENYETSKVSISGNLIECNIPGSHIIDSRWAGIGIEVEPGFHYIGPGFQVVISNNVITCKKPRFCGVMIRGLLHAPPNSKRLKNGIIVENDICLDDGSVAILLESCEKFNVCRNSVSGSVYYGIGLFPGTYEPNPEYGAVKNTIESNDFSNLLIKHPDDYSERLFTGKSYKISKKYEITSQIFLNNNSMDNTVFQPNSIIINDGLKNRINEIKE